MNKLTSIVLTGGPCAGKTTALSALSDRISAAGAHPLLVPETASTLINSGIAPWIIGIEAFQKLVLSTQINTEKIYREAAKLIAQDKPVVLLFDRGIMDGAAYCETQLWKSITTKAGIDCIFERDTRYDAIIHMVTAAKGASQFYSLENNAARTESPQAACKLDDCIIAAWFGHPKFKVVDNSTSFQEKIHKVGELVMDCMGIPLPIEAERKYKLPEDGVKRLEKSSLPFTKIKISQTYLLSPIGEERRVRERTQDNTSTYTYTVKKPLRFGERVEEETLISRETYQTLLEQKDNSFNTIVKNRHYFLHSGYYMELDEYVCPALDFTILEVETKDNPKLPAFLGQIIEVTGNSEYSNNTLAKIDTVLDI